MIDNGMIKSTGILMCLVLLQLQVCLWAGSSPAAAQSVGPLSADKSALIRTLRTVLGQLEKQQYAETEKYFALPPNFKPAMFARLIDRKIITASGIDAVELGGQFALAAELLSERWAKRTAQRYEVPLDECYVLKMEQGNNTCSVTAHWNGESFKILDLKGVGKMDPEIVVAKPAIEIGPWPTGEAPSRQLLVESLESFLQLLEAGQFVRAKKHIYVPEDFPASRLSHSLKRNEINAAGLAVLKQQGDYGKATDVFDSHRAAYFAERVGVAVEQTYGLVTQVAGEQGEAVAHWTGREFKLLRVDDIGKLTESNVESTPQTGADASGR